MRPPSCRSAIARDSPRRGWPASSTTVTLRVGQQRSDPRHLSVTFRDADLARARAALVGATRPGVRTATLERESHGLGHTSWACRAWQDRRRPDAVISQTTGWWEWFSLFRNGGRSDGAGGGAERAEGRKRRKGRKRADREGTVILREPSDRGTHSTGIEPRVSRSLAALGMTEPARRHLSALSAPPP